MSQEQAWPLYYEDGAKRELLDGQIPYAVKKGEKIVKEKAIPMIE